MRSILDEQELVDVKQDEAAQNLSGAANIGIDTDTYRYTKDQIQPQYDQARLPNQATPVVRRMIATSNDHASAIIPEADKFSMAERIFGNDRETANKAAQEKIVSYVRQKTGDDGFFANLNFNPTNQWNNISQAVQRSLGPERDRTNLWKKKFDGEELTSQEEMNLAYLDSVSDKNYGFEPTGVEGLASNLPAHIATGAVEMGAMIARHPKVFAATIGTWAGFSAAADAAKGFILGGGLNPAGLGAAVTGALVGATRGSIAGFTPALTATSIVDSYDDITANTYANLSTYRDADGKPMNLNDESMKNLARGTGILGAITTGWFMKNTLKGLGGLNKKLMEEVAANAAQSTWKNALISLGKAGHEQGVQAVVTKILTSYAQNVGEVNQGQNVSVAALDGFVRNLPAVIESGSNEKLKEFTGQLVADYATGVGTGVALGAAMHAGQTALPKVIPKNLKARFAAESSKVPVSIADTFVLREQKEKFQFLNEIVKSTNLFKLAPDEAHKVASEIMKEKGLTDRFYLSPDEVNLSPEVIQTIHDTLKSDPYAGNALALAVNAPAELDPLTTLKLIDKYPTIADHLRMEADGPSIHSMDTYLDKVEAHLEKRSALIEKLGTHEKGPDERAYELKLTNEMDDSQLKESLRSKEGAQAYLDRLDVREMELNGVDEAARTPEQAKELSDMGPLRERIKPLTESLADEKTVKETIQQAIDTQIPDYDSSGEAAYATKPVFSEEYAKTLPEGERARVENKIAESRRKTIDAYDKAIDLELNGVVDVMTDIAVDAQREQFLAKAKETFDANVDVVERFYVEGQTKHGVYAIDPESLSDAQKTKYLDNQRLKDRFIWAKKKKGYKGITPDEAAQLTGVANGDQLLKLLAETPTHEEIAKLQAEQMREQIRKQVEATTDLAPVQVEALDKAYAERAEAHIDERNLVLENSGLYTKAFLKRLAIEGKTPQGMRDQARVAIEQTKIGDLNEQIWIRGERRSQIKAAEALNPKSPDYLAFGEHKNAAILNSELTLATQLANARIGKIVKFAKLLTEPETVRMLEFSGHDKVVNEVLDLINFNQTRQGEVSSKETQKFVKEMHERGDGDFSITNMDVRDSINDYTVGEMQQIGKLLKKAFKESRDYQVTSELQRKQTEADTMQALHNKALEVLAENPDYDPKKALKIVNKKNRTLGQAIADTASGLLGLMTNIDSSVNKLDNQKFGGFFSRVITDPLYGINAYANQGLHGFSTDMIRFNSHVEKNIIGIIGHENFNKMKVTFSEHPELVGTDLPTTLSEWQKFNILLNMGSEGNRQKLMNGYRLTPDVLQAVVDSVPESHAIAAQRVMDTFGQLWERKVEMERRLGNVVPDKVEASPWYHGDKVMPGGYYEILNDPGINIEKIIQRNRKALRIAQGKEDPGYQGQYSSDKLTNQNHMKARTEGEGKINLDANFGETYATHVYDLNMRESINDVLKFLTYKPNVDAIERVLGADGVDTLINRIHQASNNQLKSASSTENLTSVKLLEGMGRAARKGMITSYLAYNPTSVVIQPMSMVQVSEAMGITSPLYLTSAMMEFADVTKRNSLLEHAYRISPELFRESQDFNTELPGKNTKPFHESARNRITQGLSKMQQAVNDPAFKALGGVDNIQKIWVAVAAYNQFLNGHAPGHSFETIQKMTPNEADLAAKSYVNSLMRQNLTSSTTLDHAVIQDTSYAKAFVNFFNDRRNQINGLIRKSIMIRKEGSGAYKALIAGDLKKAGVLTTKAGLSITSLLVTQQIMSQLETEIRNGASKLYGYGGNNDESDDERTTKEKVAGFLASPIYNMVSWTPGLSEIGYSFGMQRLTGRRQVVTNITTQGLTDLMQTANLAWNYMDYVAENGETPELGEIARPSDIKSAGRGASMLLQGIPVNAVYNFYNALKDLDIAPPNFRAPPDADETLKRMEKFEEKQGASMDEDTKAAFGAIKEKLEGAKASSTREPQSTIPDDTYTVIREIESMSGLKTTGADSTARGDFQFLRGTWANTVAKAPASLGLTINGWEDVGQQERAMKWQTEENAEAMTKKGISVTVENLYVAHFLGLGDALKIWKADDSDRLNEVTRDKVNLSNHFDMDMTIGDFKEWVSEKVKDARRKVKETGRGKDLDPANFNVVDNQTAQAEG